MPRKSAAALSVIAVDGRESRLRPPSTLSEPERGIFLDLVAACDPGHFRACDVPLLVRYCEAAALGDLASAQLRHGAVIDGKPSPWIIVQEKAVRALVALSMRLRLSPQARQPNNAGRRPAPISHYDRQAIDAD
jgi:phage terminase small subunit